MSREAIHSSPSIQTKATAPGAAPTRTPISGSGFAAREPSNKALQTDQQQPSQIDLGCNLAAYSVLRIGSGQRCCWPLNADPLDRIRVSHAGFDSPTDSDQRSPLERRVDSLILSLSLARSITSRREEFGSPKALRTPSSERLPAQLDKSRYVLGHLGAHLGIAAVFAFHLVPLPLGTVSRISWVAAEVDSPSNSAVVLGRSCSLPKWRCSSSRAVPFLGYGAYLLPLRRESSELAFVLANHTWLVRTGRTYEEFVSRGLPHPCAELLAGSFGIQNQCGDYRGLTSNR